MKKLSFKRGLIACSGVAAIAGGIIFLSPPVPGWAFPTPAIHQKRTSEMQNVTGKVVRTTQAPKGEIDGVMLEDGTWVHWPPHLEDKYAAIAEPGDRISVRGRSEVNKHGEEWFETFSLTNLETEASFERADFGPPPHHHPRHVAPAPQKQTEAIQGTVKKVTVSPKGEIDGAILKDGTVVHWPPHLERSFAPLAAKGEKIQVTGWNEQTPKGDHHFEVKSLTNTASGESARNDRPTPPPHAGHPHPHERDDHMQRLEDRLERIEQQLSQLLERQSS